MNPLSLILVLCSVQLATSLVIYRRKPKPKLICKEETEWLAIARAAGITDPSETLLVNGTYFEVTTDENSSSGDTSDSIRIIERERRHVRDEEQDEKAMIDGDWTDFELFSDSLTPKEKKALKRKIIHTCNALMGN